MANEIQISFSLRYAKNKAAASLSGSFLADQSGGKYQAGIQTVGVSEENLDKGDVGTIGFIAVRNTDSTNFVQLGSSTGVYSVKLRPGEAVLLHWTGTNVIAKADTGSCDVEYLIIEL